MLVKDQLIVSLAKRDYLRIKTQYASSVILSVRPAMVMDRRNVLNAKSLIPMEMTVPLVETGFTSIK